MSEEENLPPEGGEKEAKEVKRGPNQQIVVVTENGFGARMSLSDFRVARRGTKGMKSFLLLDDAKTPRGLIVDTKPVKNGELIFVQTAQGLGGLLQVDDIPLKARARQGVVLMKLNEGDKIVSIA